MKFIPIWFLVYKILFLVKFVVMRKELLEFSEMIDEKFESFDLPLNGFLRFLFKFFN